MTREDDALASLRAENESLAREALSRSRASGVTVGTAESCTGGLLAAAFTDVAGSSSSFVGGVVSYWVQVKETLLGVDDETVSERGVVSREVALEMARGARHALACDWALSTTGIAGPGGAEPGKPVGTVWIACAGPEAEETLCIHAPGNRANVRHMAVNAALSLFLECLE